MTLSIRSQVVPLLMVGLLLLALLLPALAFVAVDNWTTSNGQQPVIGDAFPQTSSPVEIACGTGGGGSNSQGACGGG